MVPLKSIAKLDCKMNIPENVGLPSRLLAPLGSFHPWNFELYYLHM